MVHLKNKMLIRLELHRSWHLVWLALLVHLGAFLCLAIVELAWPIKLLFSTAIVWSLFRTLSEHAFRRSRSAITTLSWTAEGVWIVWTRDGRTIHLAEGSARNGQRTGISGMWRRFRTHDDVRRYVHSCLVVLHFDTRARFGMAVMGKAVVLQAGMVNDVDAFRRLRIRLRFLY
uniref:Uncharacterized protein n=1 Tax=Candidatus Kentrum eta TaxID=2126337 RepID=A0A450VI51_9GAMM|nr:MAG: hypothetical protein BECKH772A_GA0070896_101632 [Candidatus Kentron sp. H]VFJ99531.1 MAG: hypothetical protein BECKH772B_GA0070898_101613 [Candidatus Kentron sp. H]VFK04420.1 MAG: hypothetical protein BECKH772C_GA0070978_101802 [Candidatus Kentron sp. H]